MKANTYLVLLGAASAAVHNFGPIPDGETCGHAPDNCGPTSVCGGPFQNLQEWKLANDEDEFEAEFDSDYEAQVYGEDSFSFFYDPWAAEPFHRYICLKNSDCA